MAAPPAARASLTPAESFSTKIAPMKGIFPTPNLTEKRHQVSVDHYTGQ